MRRVPLVAAGLVVVLLSACSPSQDPIPDPTTPAPVTTSATPTVDPTTPSPDPTTEPPTPTPSETLDPDQIAARDTVDEFFHLLNELSKDPELPMQPLANITAGAVQENQLASIAMDRSEGLVQVGDLTWVIRDISESSVDGEQPVVHVEACSDASQLDVISADGSSVLPDDRVPVLSWSMEVASEGGFWKVRELSNSDAKAESCE